MLKLKFDANQEYQKEAIDSIVDIFDGQVLKQSSFTALVKDTGMFGKVSELGYGNKLDLIDEDLMRNVIRIQDKHHLKRSTQLKDEQYDVPNFAVEMETGTGKTYVYTRTIMELHKKYGFIKFIIVVPSVAIREGVYKSLQITKDHFDELYPGQAFNYFVYKSSELNNVRTFATSESTEVMIINIDAFRKGFDTEKDSSAAIIHKAQDKLEGRRPIEFIQQTNPIVIIDEPQSVDNTPKSKEALKSLNPLCIFRYSATHRDSYNLMYKLGPVEAYENKLVKKIEVLSVTGDAKENAYMKLKSVSERNGAYSAKIEINVIDKKGNVNLKIITVNINNKRNLFLLSGENEQYRGFIITNISTQQGLEYIEFEDGSVLKLEESVDDLEIKKAQIRFTIESHLDKEMFLLDKGVKVLSLFFMDKVHNYREYVETESGIVPKNGKYAEIFEEEYLSLINLPKYNQLFAKEESKKYALNQDVKSVHDGYFSQDNKKQLKDTKGDSQADEGMYKLIMTDKERLLSFDTSLRFIFSHSALKEGWDNPNVFQICTLVENQDTMTKRQKIGRGLRLPVNQNGDRIYDDQINILTVVANESYESFAENLQREIEQDTNTKFGVITERLFENILIKKDEKLVELGYDASKEIHSFLKDKGFIDRHDKATQILKDAVVYEALDVPEKFKEVEGLILGHIKDTLKRLPVLKREDKTEIKLNKEVYLSPDFTDLWDKIKYKTIYQLNFDSKKLIENCVKAISKMEEIVTNPVIGRWVDVHIKQKGILTSDPKRIRSLIRDDYDNKKLPEILRYMETYTGLKRRSIADILIESKTIDFFYINPQDYMQKVVQIINEQKRRMLVDGIKYEKIGDYEFYNQDLFKDLELIGYLKSNIVESTKSVYSHIIYDSSIERTFAERMQNDDDVKLFAKLPSWFKVETPLGDYNPDWAILLDKNGEEKLYFVVETKGSTLFEDLRLVESSKIECGRKHFESLNTGIVFETADNYDEWRGAVA